MGQLLLKPLLRELKSDISIPEELLYQQQALVDSEAGRVHQILACHPQLFLGVDVVRVFQDTARRVVLDPQQEGWGRLEVEVDRVHVLQ